MNKYVGPDKHDLHWRLKHRNRSSSLFREGILKICGEDS